MVLLLDVADLLVTHFYLGAVTYHRLVVERRVEIDIFVGDVKHPLEKQLDISCTCIVL